MPSVVVYMDAPTQGTGRITADVPGMAIRMTMADDILIDGLDVLYEILGGTSSARDQVIKSFTKQFDATYKVTQDRSDAWRAQVCFRDIDAIRGNSLFSALLDLRGVGERLVVVYESGVAIMRLDLAGNTPLHVHQAETVAAKIREAARQSDSNATVRVTELSRDLEDWEPLADFTPAG